MSDRTGTTELSEFILRRIKPRGIHWHAQTARLWKPLSPDEREPIPPRSKADTLLEGKIVHS